MIDSKDTLEIMFTSITFIVAYFIGIYFHMRIINIYKKDKDITWKLDIVHYCLVIGHFTHIIFINSLTFVVPNLHLYTGEWLCYANKVLQIMQLYMSKLIL